MSLPRRIRFALVSLIAGCAIALTAVCAAAPAALADADPNVENFSYSSWDVAVDLDVTAEGRAVAHITETLVAEFPETNQNRGIVRLVPQEYLGARTDPRDFTVTDAAGAALPFEVSRDSDDTGDSALVGVLTGDDRFVHGTQEYVISYTVDDVVVHRDDATADEFYWDLIPLNRAQPIAAASATVTFSAALADHLTGAQRCYLGTYESRNECAVAPADEDGTVAIGPVPLAADEGLTVAIGLQPGTVVQPETRLPNFALDTLPLVIGGGALVTSSVGAIAVARMSRKRRGTRPVVAQYDVPITLPPLIAGPIVGAAKPTPPAEIVHLALLGATRIEDAVPDPDAKRASKSPELAIRLLDPTAAADPLDAAAVTKLFPSGEVGTVFAVPKGDTKFGERMARLASAGSKAAEDRGYFERVHSPLGRILGWVSLALVVVLAVLIALGITNRLSLTPVFAIVIAVVTLILGIVGLVRHRVLTPLGAETRNYLLGVREFIRVAEADRIAMLQSTATAERRAVAGAEVIELYERLLPYAMLFGLEKAWGTALASHYREDPAYVPLWYPGIAAGGVDRLDTSIARFSSSISSAATFSASSSGGSSGGGFAGGGGGGGFAGGR
ncbi:DUF2207 family protein [Leucobacter luti]|uniref:Putative membrane protein DUF2207 n=1 Tax=Leucobacter luti TaxID=340320 RepID=A0A4Q7TV75_9MICO|nr:DUF2207 domain-containing protein [Leucobacter luti]MBL3698092.1 DUF2207 domain-containing protein [Leucobacter luti]RZT64824.1 putative membrane protein DUF2207 [Leucobacter luti]